MNDDERRTTEHITRVAREAYHAPPATPREEMWAEIEARLDRGGSGEGTRSVLPLAGRRTEAPAESRRLPWWLAIAAALVIGLGIGRLGFDRGIPRGAEPGATPMAEAPDRIPTSDQAAAADTAEPVTDGTPVDAARAPTGEPTEERTLARGVSPARDVRASPGAADRDTRRDGRPTLEEAAAQAAAGDAGASFPYLVATRQHLGRSESFLTSVRAELDEGGADPQVGPWARSLLVRTRLLLGSPAASDVETRRLLEDLELMLAQIAIAAENRDPGETKILDRGLEEGNLLYRLRSATDGNIGSNARGPRASSL